jgi:taurine transport system substrate-binding protein
MQLSQIAASWLHGDIDAAFVWGPVLNDIKRTENVLITSDQLRRWGKTTFDGMVVDRTFAKTHVEFMATFVRVLSRATAAYRENPSAWTPDSDGVRAIVEIVGGKPEDVPIMLALYVFPSLKEQASCLWLGCGVEGGAALALQRTARFLKDQQRIPALQSDYSKFVTSAYVEAALKPP